MMEYITAKPRTLTATETRLLRSIESAGWWSVDARCLSYDDQEALEFLWRTGYIERKAYGGWGMKGQGVQQTPAAQIAAILREHGVAWVGEIRECKTAWAWSPNCYAFVMPRGVVLGAAREAFKRVVCNDRLVVVELKGS